MQWPWHKPPVQVEYVPIVAGSQPREVAWQDADFLLRVVAFGNNETFNSLVLHALTELRSEADRAETPEKLAGIQLGVKALRAVLTAPALAKQQHKLIMMQGTHDRDEKRAADGRAFG